MQGYVTISEEEETYGKSGYLCRHQDGTKEPSLHHSHGHTLRSLENSQPPVLDVSRTVLASMAWVGVRSFKLPA